MTVANSELMRQHEAHAARRVRLWGNTQTPKAAPRLVVDNGRKPVDASYHVTLYRAYQQRIRENFALSGSFSVTASKDYCPYTSEIVFAEAPIPRKTMHQIALEVLEDFPGVTLQEIKGKHRAISIATPRQLIMYEIARQLPGKSYPEIGRFLGRDHTTILHAVRKMKALYENDADSEAWMVRKERGSRESHIRSKQAISAALSEEQEAKG